MKKVLRLAAAAVLMAALLSAGTAEAAKPGSGGGGGSTTLTRGPILFVHGWNSNDGVWVTMKDRFLADGWTSSQLYSWSYNTAQSNKTTAQEVLAKVDQIRSETGAAKVDVITHSMGGLSSRWCVKFTGCDTKVDGWVSLGGPNHGTDTANFCFNTSCYEMRQGSAFLNELNSGDETPGTTTRWATWWSPCDTVINPDSSVSVSGATNTKTACLSHSALYEDATVYGQVRNFVATQ